MSPTGEPDDGIVLDSTGVRLLAATAAEQAAARAPSLVAGVVRGGRLVWSGARGGVVSVGEALAPSVDTQYRIGSITKVLTAILVLQLRDEGRLELTDRLDRHLPGVAYGDRTLRELLSHSSGMPAEPPGPWWERNPGVSFDALAGRLDGTTAPFPPGKEYHYSNVGYALLGELVSRHREQRWVTVLRDRVLEPLGMTRTSYDAEIPSATGYSVDAFTDELTPEPSHDSGAMAPAGQLWSTVGDLGRLAGFLVDPDPAVLAPDSVAEMTVGQVGVPDGGTASYALGQQVAVVGDRPYRGHTGSVPGFTAGLFVDRARRTGAVCLANAGYGLRAQGFPVQLLSLLEEAEPTITPAWTPAATVPAVVHDLMGLWFWGNLPCTLSWRRDRVAVTLLREGLTWCTFRIEPPGRVVGATGYFAGEELATARRPDGSVSHLECATFLFTRVPYDPAVPGFTR